MIRASGAQRFRITRQRPAQARPVGGRRRAARRRHGRARARRPASHAPTALGKLIQSLQHKAEHAEPMPLQQPWQLDDCGWVANRWCELLPLPVQLKQRLMELDNPLVRLELVSDVLARTGIADLDAGRPAAQRGAYSGTCARSHVAHVACSRGAGPAPSIQRTTASTSGSVPRRLGDAQLGVRRRLAWSRRRPAVPRTASRRGAGR